MANWVLEALTPWVGTGAEDDAYRPQIADDYAISKFEDITGTASASLIPAPNLYVVRVECEAGVVDAIEADGTYFVLSAAEMEEEI